MTVQQFLHAYATDRTVHTILALIFLDLVLGVLAALKLGTFRLAYVDRFVKDDVLGKVVPYLALLGAKLAAKNADVVIPGVEISAISDGIFAFIVAGMAGSVFSSLADLGLGFGFPKALVSNEHLGE